MYQIDKKCKANKQNETKQPQNIMTMFVNGMQQPGDTQQYLFVIKDDGENGSYVYNRLVQLNNESKWYFLISDEDFVGMNGAVSESSYEDGIEKKQLGIESKMEQNLILKRYFQDNMIDENRWPRKNCDRDEMKKMTFLVNYMS